MSNVTLEEVKQWQRLIRDALEIGDYDVMSAALRMLDVLRKYLEDFGEEEALEYRPVAVELISDTQHLGNLLARIHRDGGHYQDKHGTAKAVADADAIICQLQALEESVKEEDLP